MAETYCGKNCSECAQKEALNCPGCKTGPGRHLGGDCELAKCVRSKGHETCDTCGFKGNCGTLRGCDRIPDYRRRKIEAEQQHQAALAARAPVLGKWLWLLFWLVIPNLAASLMTLETLETLTPALYTAGQILNAVVLAAYGLILIRLSAEEERYRTAGIFYLIACGISLLISFVSGGTILSIPGTVVTFIGEYNEYMAHSAVLTGVDNGLSDQWEKLWKWYAGLVCAMIGGLLLMIILPLLGALAILAAAIGTIVTGILKLVYLYRTAKVFREYTM